MHRIDRWKLADELNVYQIALLIAGYDPSEFSDESYERWPQEVKNDIHPFLTAVKNAATRRNIIFHEIKYQGSYDDNDTNWHESLVNIDSLREWMLTRNFSDGFFVSKEIEDRFSDASGAFYAPKLAAAVRAWNEVTAAPEELNGKTPKKALEVWLRKHANEYGLTNKDGNPNELGIEEICKVANWKPGGGASPTPTTCALSRGSATEGSKVKSRPPTPPKQRSRSQRISPDLDDDIPF